MKKVTLVLTVTAALALTLAARGPLGFDAYDTNRDGVVTEFEFNEAKAARMNANANEGKQLRNAGNSPDFGFFDTNKDGKITKDELDRGHALQMQKNKGKGGQ